MDACRSPVRRAQLQTGESYEIVKLQTSAESISFVPVALAERTMRRTLHAAYLLCALISGALAAFAPSCADAQEAARGPVKILLGFADEAGYTFAQLISESIGNAMGRPVVIERKPGATGRIAAEALKNSDPDGTTLYLAPIVVPVVGPLVFRNLRYDPVKDFAPVTQVLTFRYALAVGPNHPARTGPEFIAWAKTHGKRGRFRDGRCRQRPALLRCDDRPGDRHAAGSCALQRRGADASRPDGRPDRRRRRFAHQSDRVASRRQDPDPRRLRAPSVRRCRRRYRRSGNRASRPSTRSDGPPSTRARERRSR